MHLRDGLMRGFAAILHARMQALVVYAHERGEVLQDHRLAIMFDKHVIGSGAGLLARIGPSAVSRFVMAVWINAIKRHVGRAFAHVAQEVLKTVKPILAHLDPATAVNRIFMVIRIKAPTLGRIVRTKSFALLAIDRVAMLKGAISDRLNFEATATLCRSGTKSIINGNCASPAIARKKPISPTSFYRNTLYSNKPSKSLAGYVNCFGHEPQYQFHFERSTYGYCI